MPDFIDLAGASGAAYRFRRLAPESLPATAGNLVVAAGRTGRRQVVLCAALPSLSQAAAAAARALKGHPAAGLYVRLNVARAVRDAEHADLLAGEASGAETLGSD
ncbi:hypothetical protein [Phenylobacterium sp.]|uniref:hypothetical protein n=1 Tax=Phenylobacterium sp. TaxID=1871053 RepID=UPI0025EA7473|nr:hypothetical protein [Phenylobacterium sp.]